MDMLARSISAFALIVSAFSLLISFLTYRRDRVDLRVSLHYQFRPGKMSAFDVRVTNHGRRIGYVEQMHILFDSGVKLYSCIAGGMAVNEGQPFDHWIYMYDGHGRLVGEGIPTSLKGAEIYDTLGNRYKYPNSVKSWMEFRKLKRKIGLDWNKFRSMNPKEFL